MAEDLDDETLAFLHRMLDLARDGGTQELARHLEAGVPPNLTNAQGDSLLILAAYHGHAETVRVLLANGADTARINDRGQTALAAAAFRQQEAIVDDLLAAGADPLLGSPSAVEVARFFELPAMVERLQARAGGAPPA